MANNQTNQVNTLPTEERSKSASGTTNSGRFEKGSDRAREAGRKGGQKSSRSA